MSVESPPIDSQNRPLFPFVAVIGQPLLKRALLLGLLAPELGGILIQGPRGVAKSTLARGLTDFIDDTGGHFVELPLGTSSDRLTGSIDLGRALSQQQHTFQPGLLAAADGGILYSDEVNLLDDSLVDLLLDAAASGVNHVERDGLSHTHPARFLLIGTMNPDEGELRPQLSDRFGLSVQLDSTLTTRQRIDIVRARIAFDADPAAFIEGYRAETQALAVQLREARKLLPAVRLPDDCEVMIAGRAAAYELEGVRADIAWRRAAAANAALEGRPEVTQDDIALVEPLVVNHRRDPLTPPSAPNDNGGSGNNSGQGNAGSQGDGPHSPAGNSGNTPRSSLLQPPSQEEPQNGPASQALNDGDQEHAGQAATRAVQPDTQGLDRRQRRAVIKRPASIHGKGRQPASHHQAADAPIDWFQTLLHSQGRPGQMQPVRRALKGPLPTQQLIMLDVSGSTLSNNAIDRAAKLVLALADKARYQRSRFALLGFGQQGAHWIFRGRRPPAALLSLIQQVQAGGGTPLQEALDKGRQFLLQRSRQHPTPRSDTYLITDGRSSRLPPPQAWPGRLCVIDNESGRIKLGRAALLAQQLGGSYWQLEEMLDWLPHEGHSADVDSGKACVPIHSLSRTKGAEFR